MKRILFVVLSSLVVALTMNAQTLSGNKIIDEMLKDADSVTASWEAELEKQGIKSELSAYYDSEKNQYVQSYRLFNQEIFNIVDAEKSLSDAISGMVAVMAENNSENILVWIGNEFKRTNTGMRVEWLCGNRKKTASATADEILETIYKMFQ